jgi:hypothetical protein
MAFFHVADNLKSVVISSQKTTMGHIIPPIIEPAIIWACALVDTSDPATKATHRGNGPPSSG